MEAARRVRGRWIDDASEVKLLTCEVLSVKCLNISQIPVLRQVKTCKSAFVWFTS